MELIRPFERLGKDDAGIAGGKGASLGEMTQAGIPVPPGFVILADSFERFLREADLNQELEAILDSVNHEEMHTVEHASEKIQALIIAAKMPEGIVQEIRKNFDSLGAQFVAVRSSATAEDSSSAAWAGQLDTYLNTTEEELLTNVSRCWASLFTPRAIFYRFEKGMHGTKISVAVVVQKMVQSEVSGIAFSVHPVTEDYNQMIIEAGFGLGEAIVSGQVTPDSFVIEKEPRRIVDKNITYQSRALWRAENGGNEWTELSEAEGSKPALSDEQAFELADIIMRIENHYGFPCDIEWAFEAGHFYITQSRPITTLTEVITPATTRPIWKHLVSRNGRPYVWSVDVAVEQEGSTLGPISWKYGESLCIKDTDSPLTSEFTRDGACEIKVDEHLAKVNRQVSNGLDGRIQLARQHLKLKPGKTRSDVAVLAAAFRHEMQTMLLGFDITPVMREYVRTVMGEERFARVADVISTPIHKTYFQKEGVEIGAANVACGLDKNILSVEAGKLARRYGFLHQEFEGRPWDANDYEREIREHRPIPDAKHSIKLQRLSVHERWLIKTVRESVYMFDEAKNAMIRAYWTMRETIKRMGVDERFIFYMNETELAQWCAGADALSDREVSLREEGYAFHAREGFVQQVYGNNAVQKLIEDLGITHFQKTNDQDAVKGVSAFKGIAKGKIVIVRTYKDAERLQQGDILVASMTTPELLAGMYRAAAFVTDEGGITCHAAIIAREMKKPCIIGTKNATRVFKDGDMVEVDAEKGIVRKL